MRLKDKVALITGGARGIGRAIALTFAREGADIVVADVNLEVAQKTASEIEALGRKALALEMDVTDFAKVEDGVNKILDKFGKVDILVNNAGITKDNLLLRMSESDWDAVLDINLKGVFICTKAIVKHMMKARKGKIINIASIAGLVGRNPKNYNSIAYGTSKGALVNFTRDLAVKWAQHNIQVNAMCPGFFVTPINVKMFDKVSDQIVGEIPLGRTGGEDDLKGLVVVLASDASNFMTGTVIPVDGGTTAW